MRVEVDRSFRLDKQGRKSDFFKVMRSYWKSLSKGQSCSGLRSNCGVQKEIWGRGRVEQDS